MLHCLLAGACGILGLVFTVSSADSAGQNRALGLAAYQVRPNHPRLLIEDVREMAQRCEGPLADDYQIVKQRADAAVRRGGLEFIANGWSIPEDLMNCGLAFLVERECGREHRPYAEVIIKHWGDGHLIANRQGSHFGYHALADDWIYDVRQKRRSGILKMSNKMVV